MNVFFDTFQKYQENDQLLRSVVEEDPQIFEPNSAYFHRKFDIIYKNQISQIKVIDRFSIIDAVISNQDQLLAKVPDIRSCKVISSDQSSQNIEINSVLFQMKDADEFVFRMDQLINETLATQRDCQELQSPQGPNYDGSFPECNSAFSE